MELAPAGWRNGLVLEPMPLFVQCLVHSLRHLSQEAVIFSKAAREATGHLPY